MSQSYPNDQSNPAGAIPVWIAPGIAGEGYTPVVAPVTTITTGGTAVTVLTGPISGGTILNPASVAAQGIDPVENLYISFVGTPGSTDAAAIGGTLTLVPGASYSLPALASGVTLKANATTSAHRFTAFSW
jgi:hypothetical protein